MLRREQGQGALECGLACLHQPLTMRTLATLLLAFVLAPAFAQTPCDGADHTILAGNYYYNPASLTINAGETVAWVNEGGFHDVNGDISVLNGMSYGNPEAFTLPSVNGSAMGVCMGAQTFTVPGTYEYDCSIGSHAENGMVGTITVVAPPSGCNDPFACNYDASATSDVDCIYADGTFDLSQGIWLNAIASLDPDFDCAIQPGEGVLVQVDTTAGSPVTIVVDAALQDWVNGLVAAGVLTQLNATLALSAFNNAVFSFCGENVTGDAGLTTLSSDWNGEAWVIDALGFNLAPATTLSSGCPDPDATNYDPCTTPDPDACEYAATGCNDPLACNYDSDGIGTEDCNYFDTKLFTIGENDFVDFVDPVLCDGYATYNDFPIPLTQDSTGGPLYFIVFPVVEEALIANGLELAAQDLNTVSLSVCDTVMNYNSLVIGDVDMYWDGTGFINTIYNSYVVPDSSIPLEGCPDPTSCNFNPCTHPFYGDECTYAALGTVDGDTLIGVGSTVTLTGTPADGNTFEWTSDCDEVVIDGNTITVTGTEDCEVCFSESDADGCEGETCMNLSVVMNVNERGQFPWEFMPNPAADALRVVWGGEAAVFDVFDLNGRRVHTATVYRGVTTLDLSALQPGLYLAGPQGSELQRLAIQR